MTTAPDQHRNGHVPAPDLPDRLRAVRGVVFDIDGCLVLGDKPGGHGGRALPGAVDAVAAIRATGRPVVAFTNGSSQVPADIAAGLRLQGFDLADDEVLTPAVVAAEVLAERYGDQPVLVFAGPGLVDVVAAAGVVLADPDRPTDAAAVLVGWDVGFTRDRLQAAAEAIWNGAPMLVASDARRFASASKPMAGVGGFIAQGLSYVTDTEYEVLGKPSDTAMLVAARRLGVAPADVLVAGDDLRLEVSMARRAGGVGVLVTTGVHGRVPVGEIAADQMPDLVVDALSELSARMLLADATASDPVNAPTALPADRVGA
ncbi:NagD protein [Klenkia soli]|uniref:NagD protein n=1 Tax=Klenkia soli TaxID=1052260 RepID=A0A1H0FXJ9_9ACTN|nr:HAD hydrolase-like protein [Klenkia soli]SDN99291.1 NagD protein [Klenkia soli]